MAACNSVQKHSDASQSVPDEFNNFLSDYLFDHGSWFGVLLQENELGLATPLILSDSMGYQLKEPLISLSFSEGNQDKGIEIINIYAPGKLIQECRTKSFLIKTETIFSDVRTVLIACKVTNRTDHATSFDLSWTTMNACNIMEDNQGIEYPLSNAQLIYQFEDNPELINKNVHSLRFEIPAGKTTTKHASIQHLFNNEAYPESVDFT